MKNHHFNQHHFDSIRCNTPGFLFLPALFAGWAQTSGSITFCLPLFATFLSLYVTYNLTAGDLDYFYDDDTPIIRAVAKFEPAMSESLLAHHAAFSIDRILSVRGPNQLESLGPNSAVSGAIHVGFVCSHLLRLP